MKYGRFFSVIVALLPTLICCIPNALAGVQPGAHPALKFTAFDSRSTVDLANLHGKIVVVDFWATWCHPCMEEAAHMVELNGKYSAKGLQFIGISLDEDPAALRQIIKEKNFTWPMEYEGQGWDGPTPKAWGIASIPQTFVISPDGEVLWRGHPVELETAIEEAFKNHPPQLVDPKTLEQAAAVLDKIDTELTANQPAKAMKSLATFPQQALADGQMATRYKDETEKLQATGLAQLADVDSQIESKSYSAANQKLREICQAFSGLPVAASAKAKLAELDAKPEVHQQLEAEKSEKAASDALAVANRLKADKKDALAYPRFKELVKLYPQTSAASEASAAVKTYEADKSFMAAMALKSNTKKAESILALADSYRAAGNTDLAKTKYQDVLTQFPGTSWADTARARLTAIGN